MWEAAYLAALLGAGLLIVTMGSAIFASERVARSLQRIKDK